MRAFILVLIWTIFFTLFGVYTNDEVIKFTDKYKDKISIIEEYIEKNDWDIAKKELLVLSNNYHKEKEIWYKLIDHTYFDDICLYINILDKAISTKSKTQAFEDIERIKMTLDNIVESEKFDLNHIL